MKPGPALSDCKSYIKPPTFSTMSDFICAYFGKDWTITARGFSSLKQAESHGKYMMPMAGCYLEVGASLHHPLKNTLDNTPVLSSQDMIKIRRTL